MTIATQGDTVTYSNGGNVTQTAPLVKNVQIDAFGNVVNGVQSTVVTANSTATPLGAGAVFTGTATDVTRYASANVSVFTSHASATDGLSIQQSSDGTNWDVTDTYTVPATTAGNAKTYSVQVAAQYLRVVYTNGGTLQTSFRMQTIIKPGVNPTSSVRPQDAYSNENDMQQAESFNMLWNGTTWDRMVAPNQSNRLLSAAATVNATLVKNAAGKLHKLQGYNAAAALRYLKIYNKASAPTVGTDTPVITITLPASSAFSIDYPNGGMHFATGIGYGFTTAIADADTGVLTLADITGFNVIYS